MFAHEKLLDPSLHGAVMSETGPKPKPKGQGIVPGLVGSITCLILLALGVASFFALVGPSICWVRDSLCLPPEFWGWPIFGFVLVAYLAFWALCGCVGVVGWVCGFTDSTAELDEV